MKEDKPDSQEALRGTRYYAMCEHHTHGAHKWTSRYYDKQKPAENAARMHNKMNPGHAATFLTKSS